MSNEKKTAIVYHEIKPGLPCPDGIASAWVVRQKYPNAELIGCSYNSPTPNLHHYDKVLIVDFSFSKDLLQGWMDSGVDLLVIDHHKTALQDLEGFSNAVFDMNECGATLTWKTLFPGEPMPAWLEYVRDRDLWNFELPWSEEIHESVAFMGRTMRQIDWLCTLTHEKLRMLIAPIGVKLLEPKRKRIAELASQVKIEEVKGNLILAVEIPESEARLISDLCSYLYKGRESTFPHGHDPVPFVMAYYRDSEKGDYSLSFRSDKFGSDFDVSTIARQFGGGGHRNAAGGRAKSKEEIFGDKIYAA